MNKDEIINKINKNEIINKINNNILPNNELVKEILVKFKSRIPDTIDIISKDQIMLLMQKDLMTKSVQELQNTIQLYSKPNSIYRDQPKLDRYDWFSDYVGFESTVSFCIELVLRKFSKVFGNKTNFFAITRKNEAFCWIKNIFYEIRIYKFNHDDVDDNKKYYLFDMKKINEFSKIIASLVIADIRLLNSFSDDDTSKIYEINILTMKKIVKIIDWEKYGFNSFEMKIKFMLEIEKFEYYLEFI